MSGVNGPTAAEKTQRNANVRRRRREQNAERQRKFMARARTARRLADVDQLVQVLGGRDRFADRFLEIYTEASPSLRLKCLEVLLNYAFLGDFERRVKVMERHANDA